jgi:hypothetical protein
MWRRAKAAGTPVPRDVEPQDAPPADAPPEPQDSMPAFSFPLQDLRIEWFSAGFGTRVTKVTHLPTGIIAKHADQAEAFRVLQRRIWERMGDGAVSCTNPEIQDAVPTEFTTES